MQKSDFDRLMERYAKGEVSEDEKAKIEAWLEVIASDDNSDVELSPEDEEKIFHKLTSNFTRVEDVAQLRPRRTLRPDQWMVRIAASLVIIALVAYAGSNFIGTGNERGLLSGNGVEKVILQDGSLVWLRDKSRLSFSERPDDGTRYSTFSGEGLFEVAKDADHPFIVQCGEIAVKVVGTSFNIKTGTDQIELTVLTGKVNLSSPLDSQGIDVIPLEKVIYKTTGEVERIKADQGLIASVTADTEYQMQFTNAPMAAVIKKLEGKFNVKVSLANADIRNCRITADFTDSSLQSSLEMIAEVLGIRYAIEGDSVSLSGGGCN